MKTKKEVERSSTCETKVIERGNVHHKETWTIYDEDIVGTSGNARLNETEKFERESYVLLYSHPSFTF